MDFPTFGQALYKVYSRGLKDDIFTKTLFQNIYKQPSCVEENPIDKCALKTYKSYLWGGTKIDSFAKKLRNDLDKKKFALFLKTPDSDDNRKLFVYAFKPYIKDIDEDNCIRVLTVCFHNIIQDAAGFPELPKTGSQISVDDLSGQIPLDFDAPTDAFNDKLLLEAGFHCQFIGCRKSLFIEKNGKKKDVFKTVVIDEERPKDDYNNLIAMCPECAELYKLDHTPKEMDLMKSRKDKLIQEYKSDKYLSEQKIEEGIENLLRQVDQIDFEELDKQTTDPVEIRQKIEKNNGSLYVKVNGFAVTYFNDIETVQKRLVKEGALNFNTFKSHIHAMYEEQKAKGLSQPDIFRTMSKWLADSTGESPDISEAVIAYFVQLCEVFDVIPE